MSRIWRAFGLKPHLTETFKLSPDPFFVEKVRDIVGLYINPPDGALVLCVDEKSQIQAPDRTRPVLPLRPGLPERRTHDYVRAGTTNLYAALDVASGHVIADMTERHRAVEFRRFLNLINRSVPEELDVHLLVDNVSTHKTPEIHRWLLRHPRFHLHFTPTYSSWMNLVERWFAELTNKWLRRGTHRSTRELESAIAGWIDRWNEEPKPFVWHKCADEILDTLASALTTKVRARVVEVAPLPVGCCSRPKERGARCFTGRLSPSYSIVGRDDGRVPRKPRKSRPLRPPGPEAGPNGGVPRPAASPGACAQERGARDRSCGRCANGCSRGWPWPTRNGLVRPVINTVT